jgi:NADPH2:quinone reductase
VRAVWYERTGAAPEVLTYGEMPTPSAGPGEVRVRLEASGVNPADVGRRGGLRAMEYKRVIPNSDGAGVVDQAGDGVTRLRAGQRVWLFNGQRNGRAFGTAAEYIALAEHLVTPLPDDLTFAEGATLGIPGMTAWCCLYGDGPMTGQTVLVTGGAGAVGHYAVQLAKWGDARVIATVSSEAKAEQARLAGHQVVFTGRNQELIDAVGQRTGAFGLRADVSADADNARTLDTCVSKMGGVDVLINNAAYAYRGEIGALDVSSMKKMFDTNVFGLVDITNRIVPSMKAQGSGDIVNIASTSGMKGAATATSYAGSKWALRGISQCWQAELRPHGIRVVCVCPSEVQTNFGGNVGRNNPNKLYAEDIAATIMAALNMPRRALWPELAVFANNPWKTD